MSKLFEYSLVVSEKKETSLVEPAAVLIHNTHEASLTNNGSDACYLYEKFAYNRRGGGGCGDAIAT